MFGGLDILLFIIAVVIMFAGFFSRISVWRTGRPESCTGSFSALISYLFGHKKIRRKSRAGRSHIALFAGLLVPFLLVLIAQAGFRIHTAGAVFLSLLTDLLGLAIMAGGIFFIARWYRREPSERSGKVLFSLLLLILIVITGFLAEGARLSIMEQKGAWASPAGWIISFMMPSSPLFMQLMIRIHFLGVLILLASLPFTFMGHIFVTSLNVYYQGRNRSWVPRDIPLNKVSVGAAVPSDMTWKQLLETDACVSCGRCEEHCPAFLSDKPLSPKRFIQKISVLMDKHRKEPPSTLADVISADEVWSCTTCFACAEHCPAFVWPQDKVLELRRNMTMANGRLPNEARSMIRNVELFGDTYGKGRAGRMDWAIGMDPPVQTGDCSGMTLLWTGCSGAYHPRYSEVLRSMTRILERGNVKYRVLGKEESCCGDPARRLGDERLFLDLAQKNIEMFKKYNVNKIITLCPHCYQVLKNEYNAPGYDPEVLHSTELIINLIKSGEIKLKYSIGERVALHDPCYLGRMNSVYEPLRSIIDSVPGSGLIETERNREKGLCCGGGGGRMWLHGYLGQKINYIRSKEMMKTGADVIGTACPYCLIMLEDGIKSMEQEEEPKILDLIEIVDSVME